MRVWEGALTGYSWPASPPPQENCFNVRDEDSQVSSRKLTPKLPVHGGWSLPSSWEPRATGRPSGWGCWLYGLLLEIWSLDVEAAGALPPLSLKWSQESLSTDSRVAQKPSDAAAELTS